MGNHELTSSTLNILQGHKKVGEGLASSNGLVGHDEALDLNTTVGTLARNHFEKVCRHRNTVLPNHLAADTRREGGRERSRERERGQEREGERERGREGGREREGEREGGREGERECVCARVCLCVCVCVYVWPVLGGRRALQTS